MGYGYGFVDMLLSACGSHREEDCSLSICRPMMLMPLGESPFALSPLRASGQSLLIRFKDSTQAPRLILRMVFSLIVSGCETGMTTGVAVPDSQLS